MTCVLEESSPSTHTRVSGSPSIREEKLHPAHRLDRETTDRWQKKGNGWNQSFRDHIHSTPFRSHVVLAPCSYTSHLASFCSGLVLLEFVPIRKILVENNPFSNTIRHFWYGLENAGSLDLVIYSMCVAYNWIPCLPIENCGRTFLHHFERLGAWKGLS